MWCFMFNLLDVQSILICLDQFHSLSSLILILKFHKIILSPLLGASSTRPKQSSSYSSNCIFYCSGLGVAFVHMPVVCHRFFFLYVVHFPCVWCCLLICGCYRYRRCHQRTSDALNVKNMVGLPSYLIMANTSYWCCCQCCTELGMDLRKDKFFSMQDSRYFYPQSFFWWCVLFHLNLWKWHTISR
jgi:hypothetical protein